MLQRVPPGTADASYNDYYRTCNFSSNITRTDVQRQQRAPITPRATQKGSNKVPLSLLPRGYCAVMPLIRANGTLVSSQTTIMAPRRSLHTALALLALASAPNNTFGQLNVTCFEAPCLNGGTCSEPMTAEGGHHRHLQDICTGATVTARTGEINAQCCGTDDTACAAGIPTSCDSGCAAAFLPFWKVSNSLRYNSQQSIRTCLYINGRATPLPRPRPSS